MIGIALGQFCLAPFQAIARAEVAQIHLPVAVLIWLMVIPMLMNIDFAALAQVKRALARHLGHAVLVKPFSMALLGWLFIGWLFRPYLPGRSTATSPA